jgi:type III restriction enzyme
LGQVLRPSREYNPGYELALVNLIRERVNAWRDQGYPGVTRTTLDLLHWWRREGRRWRLFFAQREAVETIIFLTEARADFRQGLAVPLDEPSDAQREQGARAFLRYACKMATGSGKTTVMGMLAAWSILNKVNDRADARFSDVVLIVCPNVTIRNRLGELDPSHGEASLYRTRDLVPAEMMPQLSQGKVLITNWHAFALKDPNTDGVSARVRKVGVEQRRPETIRISDKTTTARGSRYLTEADYHRQRDLGLIEVKEEKRDGDGRLVSAKVMATRYVQSDAAWDHDLLGKVVGGKQNLLVFNDEAHHAYRIRREEEDEDEQAELFGEDEEADDFYTEATVWMDGLDRIHKLRGINACIDLSATPYFLGRVGQDTNKPFPWVVSDFSLTDAIESGLVKIPQLAVRDTTGAAISGYFNIWKWILETKLTRAEKGGKRSPPKAEAILKYAHTPIAMLGGLWEETRQQWLREHPTDPRSPVFIIVCKNTKIAKVVYEWLAEGKQPAEIAPAGLPGFRNRDGEVNTIRVDTKVVQETDTGSAKSDEMRWMRFTLDTVGKTDWPRDSQGRAILPEGFGELAEKLGRPLHPPGRDVRCIVSVGMLTEGWDCNTVTHIVGLRPFMSQLLCEQVVGRGLRRTNYDADENGRFGEEVAKVFGVPFEVIPFKADPDGPAPPPPPRFHVHAVPAKERYRIEFPRVEGYTQAVRNRVTIDWENEAAVPPILIDPLNIPPEVEMKGQMHRTDGRPSLSGPGRLESVTLNPYRQGRRMQELVFDLSRALTRTYVNSGQCEAPPHVLFPQIARIVEQYLERKVKAFAPNEKVDAFCSPYYGWIVERLAQAIRPDAASGEAPEVPRYEENRGPGSSDEVSFWTSRPVREVVRSHLNYVVADTQVWEQSAAYFIDTHPRVEAFVKNSGLGFAIPYLHNGAPHDYEPDFVVRLTGEPRTHLILETKGYDPLEQVKAAAAERWVNAVNADGRYGRWLYRIARRPTEVHGILDGL